MSFLHFFEKNTQKNQKMCKNYEKTLDKSKKQAYNVTKQITKGGTAMFASKFYYFYMFNLGCPNFVKVEK